MDCFLDFYFGFMDSSILLPLQTFGFNICVYLWTVSWTFNLDLWTVLTVYHCEHLDLIFVSIYGLFPGLLDWISLGKVHFSDF